MEYITMAIRWNGKPNAHINVWSPEDSGVIKWSLTRWEAEKQNESYQHLTIICMKVDILSAKAIENQLLRRAKNLWDAPRCLPLTQGSFDVILDHYVSVYQTMTHMYVTLRTPCSGSSFYRHMTDCKDLVEAKGWTLDWNTIACDPHTIFQLYCVHEPHSVALIVKNHSVDKKLLQIRCDEPMRIRDLLMKYGINCDMVWSDTVSLSANSPCIALNEHAMGLIYTEAVPGMATDRSTAGPEDRFYCDMKFLKVRTKYSTMRNKPYSIPTKSYDVSRGASLLNDDLTTQEGSSSTLPTLLYYSDPLSTIYDVLSDDGRFLPDCYLTVSDDEDTVDLASLGTSPICQWQANQLCIEGPTMPPFEDRTIRHPYECTVCEEASDVYLDCGHLCCQVCIASLGNREATLIACPLCRKRVAKKNITTAEEITKSCPSCGKDKCWLSDCGHVCCVSCDTRCKVCAVCITKVLRMYL